MEPKKPLNIIYTNIGRGHPFYLDGIVDKIKQKYSKDFDLRITDLFSIPGIFSKFGWRLVRLLYHHGSQGGLMGRYYGKLRRDREYDRDSLVMRVLGNGIRKYIKHNRYPTLVAHPLLARMIGDLTETYYQHGEIAVPKEAIVESARKVFVPLEESADIFRKKLDHTQVVITGLCLENYLSTNAKFLFDKRINRIRNKKSLTAAFVSSGAEPMEHIKKIIAGVKSVANSNNRAILFVKKRGSLEKMFRREFSSGVPENIRLSVFSDRSDEYIKIGECINEIDILVAPSHERTNWAVGAGIPIFILHPIIGTFSPLNREFMLNREVAFDINNMRDGENLGSRINELEAMGLLEKAVSNGFGMYKINGFEKIADFLAEDIL